jgi:hypothetical protein
MMSCSSPTPLIVAPRQRSPRASKAERRERRRSESRPCCRGRKVWFEGKRLNVDEKEVS